MRYLRLDKNRQDITTDKDPSVQSWSDPREFRSVDDNDMLQGKIDATSNERW